VNPYQAFDFAPSPASTAPGFAILAAVRSASSLLNNGYQWLAGLILEIDIGELLPVDVMHDEAGSLL
jgi:hypothetical protein